jgi:hypothetical protein
MSADEMEIINPVTTGKVLAIDSNNKVVDDHDCTFSVFSEDATCTICGKSLGDFIAEDPNPTEPRIPIILVPGGQSNE